MAVVAPMPSASVRTAVRAKPGERRNCRIACRRSASTWVNTGVLPPGRGGLSPAGVLHRIDALGAPECAGGICLKTNGAAGAATGAVVHWETEVFGFGQIGRGGGGRRAVSEAESRRYRPWSPQAGRPETPDRSGGSPGFQFRPDFRPNLKAQSAMDFGSIDPEGSAHAFHLKELRRRVVLPLNPDTVPRDLPAWMHNRHATLRCLPA